MSGDKGVIGFTCAYTPLPLIHAAGFAPYRILPNVDCPDQAGHLLHDNLCPHVKRVLDRAMSGMIPDLHGMVFLNSCDSMRRLYDAWRAVKPGMNAIIIDLPAIATNSSIGFFRAELERLAQTLAQWGGSAIDDASLAGSIDLYYRLSSLFAALREKAKRSELRGDSAALQEAYNRASISSPEESIVFLEALLQRGGELKEGEPGVPVYLFGNMLPEPEAFTLFESCGAHLVADDLCTGSRLFAAIETEGGDGLLGLARGILRRSPCARTFNPERPGSLGEDVVAGAKMAGAKGVIGYTAKFCDPYIARLPGVRDALKREGIPFLLLEGDCTLRSIGQHKTRIEAFVEMMR
ncbi:MAG: 2-hydroxyacyl-CoA dehydratase family protein [Smithellaceae bacterium]|nr:2-hydroxyacyl-CoA dehydratase family protein [Smithellaceae bacterium]